MNKPRGKITHVYTRNDALARANEEEQKRVGTDDSGDVLDAFADGTVEGRKCLVLCPHPEYEAHFKKVLQKREFDPTSIKFVFPTPITKKVYVPASPALEWVSENLGTGEKHVTTIAAKPAREVEKTFEARLHVGDLHHMRAVRGAIDEFGAEILVVIQPNEDAGDLAYLEMLRQDRPELDVIIWHRYSDVWGVVYENVLDPDNWEEVFPALADVEEQNQEVIVDNMLIRGNVHVVAGPPEAFKTMGLIEFSSAILDQRPVFDLLEVKQRYPIMFLCADMSPVQLDQWAAPFDLRKHGEDFRVMRGNGGIPNITDPVLQKAVRGRILILDTMLDFARIQKAFESGEWNTFMENLRTLMNVHGCIAIVMTAHSTRAEVKSDSDNLNRAEYFKDSVTFHGKTDIGFGCKVLKDTSQIKWERLKGRGFKYHKFSFTVAVYDEEGNSNLDRGRFPVCVKPEGMKEFTEQRRNKPGPKKNTERDQQILDFKQQGKSYAEIAALMNVSPSTVKRCKPFDSDVALATLEQKP